MTFKKIAVLALIAGMSLNATTASAGSYVTQKQIDRDARGYAVKAKGLGVVRILSVTPREGKGSECKVHVPSIIKEARLKLAQGGAAAGSVPVKVEIQVHHNPYTGDITCFGGGTGCVAVIQVNIP